MEIYLVGGAVRDTLLGRAVLEKDWVVVGASYEQCLAKGWRPIAVGVPVFLDPATGEEYAMARKERKTGIGYRGFDFEYGQHISLEEDLRRRDLTVNALAMNANGELIDPFGHIRDIEGRILRHISTRFTEDPVRVVRLCSLYARLRSSGFAIAPTTLQLIRDMTSNPSATEEFSSIRPQQMWAQLEKALASDSPDSYAETLDSSGAGKLLLDAGLLTPEAVARLKFAAQTHADVVARLGVWICPLEAEAKERFFARCEIPRAHKRFCDQLATLYPFYVHAGDKPIPDILEIFKKLDAFANADAFAELTQCCHTLFAHSSTTPAVPQVQKEFLNTMLSCASSIDRSRILRRNIDGTPQMAIEIDKHRSAEMARVRRYYPWSDLSVGKNRPQ
ncbi:MAG: multifunctional CCA tRNA nucleotidyl transferase/2'3'-cyclic phosphodiesterase/2'nucleotidase/phosphatase [Proteobacteria bacterium]|nr:multifunctional CCA tRNA nucleotidyl transferase/2'3'-cyclic phosphodiesterase/2'nucleotidase/phosphatase [Pseudomonadota bacterium]